MSMHILILTITSIMLVTSSARLTAQTSFTSPAGFAAAEANAAATHAFAFYSNGRYQWIDGELRGNRRSLAGIHLRANHEVHSAATCMGRSFTSVNLVLAESATLGATFTANYATSGQRVYAAGFSLPSYLGTLASRPVPWNEIALPFMSPFAYSGGRDLLLDFAMHGGVLVNKMPWSGGTAVPYHLDGYLPPAEQSMATVTHPAEIGVCRDSSIPYTQAARTLAIGIAYGKTYAYPEWRGLMRYQPHARNLAPSAAAVLAITDRGSSTGTKVGARCQNLHVDLASFTILVQRTADEYGWIVPGSLDFFGVHQSNFAGRSIWAQTAWIDSKLGTFSLTTACESKIPSVTDYVRHSLFSHDPTSPTGRWYVQGYGFPSYSPVILYTTK